MFAIYQNQLRYFLVNLLETQEKNYCDQKWAKDVFRRLKSFAVNGKLFRGSLCLAIATELKKEFPSSQLPEDYLKIATSLELIHSALLIQDDIMDQDQLRRNQSTIHQQYQQLAENQNFAQTQLFGLSAAICVSDLCQFLAWELISSTRLNTHIKDKLIKIISHDINQTALAQISDCEFALSPQDPTQEEILAMYLAKTGHYTFSLPMLCGAGLAGLKDKKSLGLLAKIGEKLGIIFQIKDDELGIYGETENTGKPVGNDIKENKKTIWRYYLLKSAPTAEKAKLNKLFGNKNLKPEDLNLIKQAMIDYQVKNKIDQLIEQKSQLVKKNIQQLKMPQLNQFLENLLEFNLQRNK